MTSSPCPPPPPPEAPAGAPTSGLPAEEAPARVRGSAEAVGVPDGLSVAAGARQEVNDPGHCPHGLPLSGTEECRSCLPGGATVRWFVRLTGGADQSVVGAMLGVSRQAVQQAEHKALRKLGPKLARVLGITQDERGEVVSEQERFARIVRRMLSDGFDTDEIIEALSVPRWRVDKVLRPDTRRGRW